jgi:hypothetical protein
MDLYIEAQMSFHTEFRDYLEHLIHCAQLLAVYNIYNSTTAQVGLPPVQQS